MQILRIESVQERAGHKSKSTVYNDVRSGQFTSPVKIGKRSVGWPDFEVEAICRARVAGWSKVQIRALVTQLHESRSTCAPTMN